MNESKWIRLSPDDIAPSFHPDDAAWAIESPSPYDIPSHARSEYDPVTGCFVIEFKYIEAEPLIEVDVGEYFKAKVGKKTKRVWSIRFDAHAFHRDRKAIALAATNSMNEAKPSSISNAKIAARAITTKGDSLMQAAFG